MFLLSRDARMGPSRQILGRVRGERNAALLSPRLPPTTASGRALGRALAIASIGELEVLIGGKAKNKCLVKIATTLWVYAVEPQAKRAGGGVPVTFAALARGRSGAGIGDIRIALVLSVRCAAGRAVPVRARSPRQPRSRPGRTDHGGRQLGRSTRSRRTKSARPTVEP